MFVNRVKIFNFQFTCRIEEHLTKQNPVDEEIRVDRERAILENEINYPVRVFCLYVFYVVWNTSVSYQT